MGHLDNKDTVKLNELIKWVKKEILSDEVWDDDDPAPLFAIDEVTVEVNFVLSGDIGSGVDLAVLKADSKVSEERVQKAVIRMKPLVPTEELAKELSNRYRWYKERVVDKSLKVILKGKMLDEDSIHMPE